MCVIIQVLPERTQAYFGVQLITGNLVMNYTLSPLHFKM